MIRFLTALSLQVTVAVLLASAAQARDPNGEHANSPLRGWFKSLTNPKTGAGCCDISDCKRTEATIVGDHYRAVAPDGAWLDIPNDAIVVNRGNPTGEPILCALPKVGGGWQIYCFVPGGGV